MNEKVMIEAVRERLGIEALNELQREVLKAWKSSSGNDLVVYSPTGTGKTLAFALCLLHALQPPMGKLQAVVIAPSRELVMQTAEILRSLAQGYTHGTQRPVASQLCYSGRTQSKTSQG